MNDPIRQEVLEQIAKNGRAYTNEAKAMAEELIQLRAKLPPTPQGLVPIDYFYRFGPHP